MKDLLLRSTALLALGTTAFAAAPAPLNILWLIAEDTGPSAYSCYGEQPAAHTPNIDRLAAEGVRYTRFFTTAPVCSPSRSAFNTGMYQTTLGAHQHRTPDKKPLPAGVRTLPEWFRAAGYHTANVREFPAAMNLRGAGKTDWNFITATNNPFTTATAGRISPAASRFTRRSTSRRRTAISAARA